jgi:hypothetical protein
MKTLWLCIFCGLASIGLLEVCKGVVFALHMLLS